MPYEIIASKKGQSFKQRQRIFELFPDKQKQIATQVANGLKIRGDYLWVEVSYVKEDS